VGLYHTSRSAQTMAFPMMRLSPNKVAAGVTLTFAHSKVVSMSSSSHPTIRVASYNVLSDSLCEPSHFFKCKPDDLAEEVRFRRVQAQLEEEMKKGAVLCLQEVSRNWGGRLIPFFEKYGYSYAGKKKKKKKK
jgi:mRNA deadenylase 3'-5' endonuclease subunit Ccr4